VPCWYRFFLELPPKRIPGSAQAVADLCHDLVALQRSGCIAAASLISTPDPFGQIEICAELQPAEVVSCLHGVGVQNLATSGLQKQLALIRTCRRLPPEARAECSTWVGKTLSVVTNGRFSPACDQLDSAADRSACTTGATHTRGPLVTFS